MAAIPTILKGDDSGNIVINVASGRTYTGATLVVAYQGVTRSFTNLQPGGTISFAFTHDETSGFEIKTAPLLMRLIGQYGAEETVENAEARIRVTDCLAEVNAGGSFVVRPGGGVEDPTKVPITDVGDMAARYSLADLKAKVDQIVRVLAQRSLLSLLLSACCLSGFAAVEVQTARLDSLYNDSMVVTNVSGTSGITAGEAGTIATNTVTEKVADWALKPNPAPVTDLTPATNYTDAATNALAVTLRGEIATATPGDYANVSNKAMTALQEHQSLEFTNDYRRIDTAIPGSAVVGDFGTDCYLEYLEGDGTDGFDLGVTLDSSMCVDVKYLVRNNTQSYGVFGSRLGSGLSYLIFKTTMNCFDYYTSSSRLNLNDLVKPNHWIRVWTTAESICASNIVTGATSTLDRPDNQFVCPNVCPIFKCRGAADGMYLKGRFERFLVTSTNGTDVIADYRPYRKGGVCGMLDVVSGNFYCSTNKPSAFSGPVKADGIIDVVTAVKSKQNALVSGTNIKTINGESVLGSGNIEIQGGGGGVDTNSVKAIVNSEVGGTNNIKVVYETLETGVPFWNDKVGYAFSDCIAARLASPDNYNQIINPAGDWTAGSAGGMTLSFVNGGPGSSGWNFHAYDIDSLLLPDGTQVATSNMVNNMIGGIVMNVDQISDGTNTVKSSLDCTIKIDKYQHGYGVGKWTVIMSYPGGGDTFELYWNPRSKAWNNDYKLESISGDDINGYKFWSYGDSASITGDVFGAAHDFAFPDPPVARSYHITYIGGIVSRIVDSKLAITNDIPSAYTDGMSATVASNTVDKIIPHFSDGTVKYASQAEFLEGGTPLRTIQMWNQRWSQFNQGTYYADLVLSTDPLVTGIATNGTNYVTGNVDIAPFVTNSIVSAFNAYDPTRIKSGDNVINADLSAVVAGELKAGYWLQNDSNRFEWSDDLNAWSYNNRANFVIVNNGNNSFTATIGSTVYNFTGTHRQTVTTGGSTITVEFFPALTQTRIATTNDLPSVDYSLSDLSGSSVTLRSGEIGNLTTALPFTVNLAFADNGRSGDCMIYVANTAATNVTMTLTPNTYTFVSSDWSGARDIRKASTNIVMFTRVKGDTILVNKQEVK